MPGNLAYDYTSLDFDSMQADLIKFAKSIFTEEEWTDFNASDEGVRLIELMAYITDVLAYNSNAQFLETMVSTVIRERNFLTIAKGLGYEIKRETPSVTTLEFTCDPAFFPIQLPKTFKVSDKSGEVLFEPDSAATINTTKFVIDATQGETVTGENVGISNGKPRQSFYLSNKPLIDGTLSVAVGGVPYSRVKTFASAQSSSQVYRVSYTEDSDTIIEFGDDTNGQIPQLGKAITVSYRFGGGERGNLPEGYISNLVDNVPGIISVKNITRSRNGGPKQSLDHAKLQLPLEIRTNDRAVVPSDYATLAQRVNGVLRAQGVIGSRRGGGSEIILYTVPNDAGVVPDSIANDIVTSIVVGDSDGAKGLAGKRVVVRTAVYVDLAMQVEAHLQSGASQSVVSSIITDMMVERHKPQSTFFSAPIGLQEAYLYLNPNTAAIPGLLRVVIKQFTVNPYSARYVNLPTSGNGVVEHILVTDKVSRREWNIKVSPSLGSTQEFVVTQRILGTVSSITSNSITDETALFEENALVGYRLHLDEQNQPETWLISGNSQRSITVDGTSVPSYLTSLFRVGATGVSYAVERTESKQGKIYKYSVTAQSSSQSVQLDNTLGIRPNDWIVYHSVQTGEKEVTQVIALTTSGILLRSSLTIPSNVGDYVSGWWSSDDGTVGFTLVPGTVPFSSGDELYVDTFEHSSDIKLRPENFPKLSRANIQVFPVGGVK